MGAHAVRNASGSKRWMNCAGSIALTDKLFSMKKIKKSSSHFARLGTAAHGLCEESLSRQTHPLAFLGGTVYLDEFEDAFVVPPPDLCTEADLSLDSFACDAIMTKGWEAFLIDENMADAVALYYETVLMDLEEMGPMAELSVERRFNLNWLIGYDFDDEAFEADPSYISPSGIHYAETDEGTGLYHMDGTRCWGPMFGTNDASILLMFDLLRVYDYKHGQGVIVEVENNSQEMYYALGIAHEVDWCFAELELVIVQPRAPHSDGPVRRWTCTAAELRVFEEELRVAALATEDPDATLVAGDHCGFCPAAPYCPALKSKAFEVAALDFQAIGPDSDVMVLTSTDEIGPLTDDDDLRTSLEAISMLDAFIKSVEGEAMRRLREAPGGEAFGHKLVRKRSIRQWRPDLTETAQDTGEEIPADPFDILEAQGIPREMMFEEPKRKGPAKIEALRPPELMAKLKADKVKAPAAWIKAQVASLTYKPEGGITIAHESDPRPAVDPSAAAAADFDASEDFTPVD